MDNITLVLIVVVIIVLALVFRFRHKVAISLEALGIKLKAEGQASPEKTSDKDVKEPESARQGNVADASGKRSVAIGGNANGATITTGDKNTAKTGD